jgi:hypothetical protein
MCAIYTRITRAPCPPKNPAEKYLRLACTKRVLEGRFHLRVRPGGGCPRDLRCRLSLRAPSSLLWSSAVHPSPPSEKPLRNPSTHLHPPPPINPPPGHYNTVTKDNVTRDGRGGMWLNPWEGRLTTLEERCRLQGVPFGACVFDQGLTRV